MSESNGRHYRSNMMKGGALVSESLRLVEEWSPESSLEGFRETVIRDNIIDRATRTRIADILRRIFIPRFLAENVPPIVNLQALLNASQNPEIALKALLYHTALSDDLFYDFVVCHLFDLFEQGRFRLNISDARDFIDAKIEHGEITPAWSENIRNKTGSGILAAARDFGLLEGKLEKHFLPAHLPFEVFVYVLYHLKDVGVTANRLLHHAHWRMFLLPPAEVERLLLEAHQLGFIRYNAAGNITRIDWLYADQKGAVDAITT